MRVEAVREATQDEIAEGSCGTGFFKIQVASDAIPHDRTLH